MASATLLLPVVRQCRIHLWTLSLSLALSKTLFTALELQQYLLQIYSASCMSLWLWLCALVDDLLLLPVLSVILKMYKYRSLYSCLVTLPFSVSNIQKYHILWSLYLCFVWRRMLIVQKTTHVDVRSKPATSYNDILSCVRKSKGSITMLQKMAVSFHCLLCDFRQEPHWGSFHPPRCRDKG